MIQWNHKTPVTAVQLMELKCYPPSYRKTLLISTVCLNRHSGYGPGKENSCPRESKTHLLKRTETLWQSRASSPPLFQSYAKMKPFRSKDCASLFSSLMSAARGGFWIRDFSRAITFIRLSPYENTTWCFINTAALSALLTGIMQISPSSTISLLSVSLWVVGALLSGSHRLIVMLNLQTRGPCPCKFNCAPVTSVIASKMMRFHELHRLPLWTPAWTHRVLTCQPEE